MQCHLPHSRKASCVAEDAVEAAAFPILKISKVQKRAVKVALDLHPTSCRAVIKMQEKVHIEGESKR